MSDFKWNTTKVKTAKIMDGRPVIFEMTPKEIIAEPNRHQVESIIKSLCEIAKELTEIEEASVARLSSLMARATATPEAK